MCSRKVRTTRSGSSARSSPLSTKMQVSWSPTARCTSVAATAESTPPERAQITLPSPTCSRIVATDSSTNDSAVQSPAQPATLNRKLRSNWLPCGVCTTSGWNWMPRRPAPSAMIATGELSDCAIERKPGGNSTTRSPCDIHTGIAAGRSLSSGLDGWEMLTTAWPYSRLLAGATRPPSACVSSCMP